MPDAHLLVVGLPHPRPIDRAYAAGLPRLAESLGVAGAVTFTGFVSAVADVYAYPEWAARAIFEAGRVFEQMKQPDAAKQQYNTIVNKYKDAPEAALAQKRLAALD